MTHLILQKKKYHSILNKLSLFMIIITLFSSCIDRQEEKIKNDETQQAKSFEMNISIKVIENKSFQKQIISNGKIEASKKSEVRFKTSERITSIKIKNGQKVSKSQLLANLDSEVLLNQINKAKLDLDKAESKLQEEKINYGLDEQNESLIDPDILRNLHIKSGYQEAKNALNNAQLLYNQTFLKAPISGLIANLETKVGNYITTNDVFCTIINISSFEIVFLIQENELKFIEKQQKINISPFAYKDETYEGIITEINPMINENGLVKIKAKVISPDAFLFDGMNAKIYINKPIKNVVVIPKEALVLRSNKEVVFTVVDGLAKWNYVEVLDENSTSYALKNGINIGDIVIVSGNMNLSHDAKVTATFIDNSKE